MSHNGAALVSVGHYQPDRVVTNDELCATLGDTTDAWITERIGIRARRLADTDESVTDMAVAAGAKALADAGIDPATIDLVIVATSTAINRMPSVAAQVAGRLGCTAPGAFDLNAACAGFSHALATAGHAIQAGAAHRALVVGVDKMSDFLDWQDRSTCVIFGDGAGAAVLVAGGPHEPAGIGPVVWGSDPDQHHTISLTSTGPDGPRALFRQEGPSVFRWATTRLAPIAAQAVTSAGIATTDLRGIVTHQANLRIITAIAHKLNAPDAVIATDVTESGNTSAASVPIALSKMVERHQVPTGAWVLLFGFGAGLSYAGQVIRCP